jgi:hypothetical protein
MQEIFIMNITLTRYMIIENFSIQVCKIKRSEPQKVLNAKDK